MTAFLTETAPSIELEVSGARGARGFKGDPGGNVMAVGMFMDIVGLTLPAGVSRIATAGYRKAGVGAGELYLWDSTMAALDAAGQGYWWTTSNGGTKKWFYAQARGTPEICGAYADDGAYSDDSTTTGTDDSTYIRAAIAYFDRVDFPGRYYIGKTINVLRTVDMAGSNGFEAGNYATRIRHPKSIVAFLFHLNTTNADDTGVPYIETVARAAGANGFQFRNIYVKCIGARVVYNGTNITKHSLWPKVRGLIENVSINGPAGCGIYGYASNSNSDPLLRGNINGMVVRNVRIAGTTWHGLFLNGPDANAGLYERVNTAVTGGVGVYDSSFLGNTHITHQTATPGLDGMVRYGGIAYYCMDPTLASTQVPGTGAAWKQGSFGGFPDWVSGKPYLHGQAYRNDSGDANSVWLQPYSESNNPAVFIGTQLIGGNARDVTPTLGVFGTPAGASYRETIDIVGGANIGNTLQVKGPGGTLFEAARLFNTATGSNRSTAVAMFSGFLVDGVTPKKVGQFSANSSDHIGIDAYDTTTNAVVPAFRVYNADKSMRPGADNAWSMGTASARFTQLFAATATIGTSDKTEKQQIAPIDDALLDAWADVQWRQFRFNEAVAEKGEEARIHTGLIAQDVRDVLAAHGIDGTRYGLLCYDEWDETPAVEAIPAIEAQAAVHDEEGELITPAVDAVEAQPAVSAIPAGSRWGVRYQEAEAIEAAYQRRRMDRIEARLAASNVQ